MLGVGVVFLSTLLGCQSSRYAQNSEGTFGNRTFGASANSTNSTNAETEPKSLEERQAILDAERKAKQAEERFSKTGYPFDRRQQRQMLAQAERAAKEAKEKANLAGKAIERAETRRAQLEPNLPHWSAKSKPAETSKTDNAEVRSANLTPDDYLLKSKVKRTSYAESAYYQDDEPKKTSILQAVEEPMPQPLRPASKSSDDELDLPPRPFFSSGGGIVQEATPANEDVEEAKRRLNLKNLDSKFLPTMPNRDLGQLSLEKVFASVVQFYPEIEAALGQIAEAQGKALSSQGEFDSVFAAHSISQPLGFYQTYRNGFGVTKPLFSGGEIYGTYRIGDGNFEPWFWRTRDKRGGRSEIWVFNSAVERC